MSDSPPRAPDPSPSAEPPEEEPRSLTAAEQEMIEIWRRVFDLDEVYLEDNFFSLGGDSLHATSLLAEITAVTGKRLAVNAISDAPTVRSLAATVRAITPLPGNLVPLGGGTGGSILVLVHGWGGSVAPYLSLARRLHFDGPVVGLQGDEQTGAAGNDHSAGELAERYARLILTSYPNFTYTLAGYSAGGVLAYLVAVALVARGGRVNLVVALDSRPHGVPKWQRLRMWWPHWLSRIRVHARRLRSAEGQVIGHLKRLPSIAARDVVRRIAHPASTGNDPYGSLLQHCRLPRSQVPVALLQCHETREHLLRGWRHLVGNQARIYPIAPRHEQILKDEHLDEVAAAIRTALADQSGPHRDSD